LLLTFMHLEESLSEVERVAAHTGTFPPLSGQCGELSPEKRSAILQYTAQTRKTMSRILEQKGIALDIPPVETIHSIYTYPGFMHSSAEELRPKYMRGYGELTEEAADELDGVAMELRELFKQMRSVLKK